jgi:hypothetical protein
MMQAAAVITDSGGVQEETTVLGVPCVTVRTTTERSVTAAQGTKRLADPRDHGAALSAARAAVAQASHRRPRFCLCGTAMSAGASPGRWRGYSPAAYGLDTMTPCRTRRSELTLDPG